MIFGNARPSISLIGGVFYKGCGMKKIIFGFIGMFCAISAHAVDLTLEYYDNTVYFIEDPYTAKRDDLTSISDERYYFKPFDKTLTITAIHWLGDGSGGEYEDPNSPYVFNYTDITFDWLKSYFTDYIGNEYPFTQIKNQFDNWVVNNVSELVDLSVIGISRNVVKQHNIDIYNSVFSNTRFNEDKFSVWGTTLFNSINKSGKYDYSTNGLGIVLGADLRLSDSVLIGAGYSYSNVDIDVNPSDILFDTSSVFLYSKWQLNKFYVNGLVAYNFADYEYVDSELNNGDVSALFVLVMVGYKIEYGLSPEISEYLKKSVI